MPGGVGRGLQHQIVIVVLVHHNNKVLVSFIVNVPQEPYRLVLQQDLVQQELVPVCVLVQIIKNMIQHLIHVLLCKKIVVLVHYSLMDKHVFVIIQQQLL